MRRLLTGRALLRAVGMATCLLALASPALAKGGKKQRRFDRKFPIKGDVVWAEELCLPQNDPNYVPPQRPVQNPGYLFDFRNNNSGIPAVDLLNPNWRPPGFSPVMPAPHPIPDPMPRAMIRW